MPQLEDLNSVLTRYQNHVGAYDKAKWEQSVEERILHGIAHISTKSAKLGNDLIDLDLVQGSSFPKAKPKHGLFTVTRHALLRFLFLPWYHTWWSAQTSGSLYILFIVLYVAQVFNLALYITLPQHISPNATSSNVDSPLATPPPFPVPVQTSDILSPIVLMIVLTILHSQIVSTHWSSSLRLLSPLTTANRSPSRRHEQPNVKSKPRERRNSLTKLTRKNHRRASRLPPSRRRSNNSSLTLPQSVPLVHLQSTGSEVEEKVESALAPVTGPGNNENTRNSLSPSTSKKVFFIDDFPTPKSISPSNSDRDEGIPEEITHEHDEHQDDCNSNYAMAITDPIIKKNLVETVSLYVEEQNRSMGLGGAGAEGEKNNKSLSVPAALRKRNFSKQSMSTTTPSGSGGECSSGNITDEEDNDLADDQLSEEFSPTSPNDMAVEDDEEVRKSEWTAVTTNSEDDDYVEEELNNSEDEEPSENLGVNDDPFAWEFQKHSGRFVSPSCAASDKVSCTIWEGNEVKKADLSVLDISALIIAKVERAKENSDYLYLGIFFSFIIAFLPGCWRLNQNATNFEIDEFDIFKSSQYFCDAISLAYGNDLRTRTMILISCVERLALALCVFFLLAVAEKTYKQRFLYSKLFSRITSTRKSKKSGIPHFRLNKVRNIKTWLSIRSYLQRRGPQRSVDTIVSATFIATLILICFISVELLKDSDRLYYLYNLEVIGWTLCLGIYLMRFMTLGSRISQKYRNLSVIITEQLNLYLKMEQKPHKKDELLVANNVLKLASELLKELEDPFKISSFASNPYFYNVTRLVILSAFSGVLSELLGFKLKLYKIKLK